MMESVWIDVRYAVRSITKAPAFAAIVIATLALGVGANTAVFSVLNAVLLKPLPYANAHELLRLYLTYRGQDNYLPGPAVIDFKERSRTVDIAALYTYRSEGVDLTDRAQPERVGRLQVSADYFRVMGVNLVAGRPFEAADERPNANVAVVSTRIWQDYLGRSADAIGRTLTLDATKYRIVGVVAEDFEDPLQAGIEVWTPLDMATARTEGWDNNYLSAVGRLRPGVSMAQASAELASISASQQSHYAARDARVARIAKLQDDLSGRASGLLLVLQGAVAILLVIACVNVAGLFLSRASARESELAVRAALGCSRARLVRQVLVESLMLSVAGAAVGLALGISVQRALVAVAPFTFPAQPQLDATVFAFSLAVAAVAGLFFGLAPALQFTRPDLEMVLRESSRGAGGSRRQTRTRNAFVVCQVALAVVLLVGAGLLLRTVERLIHERTGIRTDNILTFEVNLPEGRYADPARRARLYVDLAQRLESLPGVTAAGAVSRLPLTGPYHQWGTRRPDRAPDAQPRMQPQQRVVEANYFEALSIPILQGRGFDARDDARAPHRVLISRSMASALYPGEDPVGRPLNVAGRPSEIIGVVGDVPIG
ncbi:MAG TPA: ABC transporter permease, partial [Vicinamibacterales bacterium]